MVQLTPAAVKSLQPGAAQALPPRAPLPGEELCRGGSRWLSAWKEPVEKHLFPALSQHLFDGEGGEENTKVTAGAEDDAVPGSVGRVSGQRARRENVA